MTTAPSGTAPGEHEFDLSGGLPCLDFVNTVSGDRHGEARERLGGYADIVSWARQSGAIDPEHAQRLLGEARRDPAAAEAAHRDALALREALFRVFSRAADGGAPDRGDLAVVSGQLANALAHRRLERGAGDRCCALAWDDPPDALDAPLWRVAVSAADLLTSAADLSRVRVCGLHETRECSWVFLDTTRAGTRRWCSMSGCGNRAKARRHYARAKAGE